MNLTPLQRRILVELELGSASARELAPRLGLSYRTMASRISELKQSGMVDHVVCVTEHGRRAATQTATNGTPSQ